MALFYSGRERLFRRLLLFLWIGYVLISFLNVPTFSQLIWVCGDLEKVNPVTGGLMSDGTYGIASDNPIKNQNYYWNQTTSTISLSGAGNEIIAFQIVIEKTDQDLTGISLSCSDLIGPGNYVISKDNFELFRECYVIFGMRYFPEILVSFDLKPEWLPFSIPDPDVLRFNNNNQAVWVDLFIPHETPPGNYTGKITVSGQEFSSIDLYINLTVWNFTLPNKQNFDFEMNLYGGLENHFDGQSKIPKNKTNYLEFEENTYRLCHKNRLTLLIMPYKQAGTPSTYVTDSMRPVTSGSGENMQVSSWDAWDSRFDKYFDGTAFTDLYRSGTPIAHFTLPFNHTWPSDFSNFSSGSEAYPYWDKNPTYEAEIIATGKEFEKHCNDNDWNRTLFHIYYNEKSKYGHIPWNLDEPIDTLHYEGLRYYSQMMHSGFENTFRSFEDLGDANKDVYFPYPDSAKFLFRLDIGRQNLVQGYLDGWIDLWNVGGWQDDGSHNYILEELQDRIDIGEHYMVYGPWSYQIDKYNLDLLWIGWNDWKRRATGHEIWKTNEWPSGITSDWSKVFTGSYRGKCTYYYPGSNIGLNRPLPSLRLKIIRHAVQDWEYLYYLTQLNDDDYWYADEIVESFMSSEDIAFNAEFSQYNLTEESFLNARKKAAEEIESIVSGIHDSDEIYSAKPKDFCLVQNYPNPFNSATVIRYYITDRRLSTNLEIKIFNQNGQLVRTLLKASIEPGHHAVEWNGCSDDGLSVGSGIYYCCLKAGNNIQSRKIVLLR